MDDRDRGVGFVWVQEIEKEDKAMVDEMVKVEEKMITGVSVRTDNRDPNMGAMIGELWNRFYSNGIVETLKEKKAPVFGVDTEYEGDEKGDYTVIAGCETEKISEKERVSPEYKCCRIPAGCYAKFTIEGNCEEVADAWRENWQMNLSRTLESDFDEYQGASERGLRIPVYVGRQHGE